MYGMNALIPLQTQVVDFGQRFQEGQQAGQQNALRQALQQYGGAAAMGDQNALMHLAQFDPQMALGMRSDHQQMDLRGRADARSERGLQADLAAQNERMEMARQEAARAVEAHRVKMTAAERENAMQEVQMIGAFEGIEDPAMWDQTAETLELPELKGQFDQRAELLGMALGVREALAEPMEPTAEMRNTTWRAAEGGLEPGSPEYQDFVLNGGVQRTQDVGPTFRPMTPEELTTYAAPPGSQIDTKTGRAYPAETRGTTSEGERRAAGFLARMENAEAEFAKTPPSSQQMNMLQSGAIGMGVPEGYVLSGDEERARQFQIDWVRAKLRLESGAVIGAEEAWEEAAAYFPRPGDSTERIRAKAESRQMALQQVRMMAGREAANGEPPEMPSAQGAPEIPAEIMDQLRQSPPGTVIRGQNGEVLQWDGAKLNPL